MFKVGILIPDFSKPQISYFTGVNGAVNYPHGALLIFTNSELYCMVFVQKG